MKLNIVSGDIFKSKMECVTDANNSIGISGAGLALAFAKRYPEVASNFNKYSMDFQELLFNGGSKTASLLAPVFYRKDYLDNHDYHIVKFPTMIYPGEIAKEENIKTNLNKLQKLLKSNNIKSIALPALGCGIGRYDFALLEKQIRTIFENDDIELELYRPN